LTIFGAKWWICEDHIKTTMQLAGNAGMKTQIHLQKINVAIWHHIGCLANVRSAKCQSRRVNVNAERVSDSG
jgi:hypothetical protein